MNVHRLYQFLYKIKMYIINVYRYNFIVPNLWQLYVCYRDSKQLCFVFWPFRKSILHVPDTWNVPFLVRIGTFLVYEYHPILVYLHGLEQKSIILKLTYCNSNVVQYCPIHAFQYLGLLSTIFPTLQNMLLRLLWDMTELVKFILPFHQILYVFFFF